VTLQTDGESSLSGTLSDRGAYVLTGTRLLFFARGEMTPSSSQPLLKADGSAAQVTLADGYAYVSEKNGSLEAFSLRRDGDIQGSATPVAGVPVGVIVGISGVGDLVVAPIAHLASNANQSAIPVVSGLSVDQIVPTKEVAASWAPNDDCEACIRTRAA
jgi:anti-sigma factor RsiW